VTAEALLKGTYLDQVVALGRAAMGDGHAGAETLAKRLAVDPTGLTVLVRRSNLHRAAESVVGYFAIWSLSTNACEKFLSGRYSSGLDIVPEDLDAGSPRACYVTMVLGTDLRSRLEVLRFARNRLQQLYGRGGTAKMLLARPATKEGERLMRRLGMEPVSSGPGLLWSVDRETLLVRLRSVDV
jgi:hypothetical protein